MGICEGMWILRLLQRTKDSHASPMEVWCDNIAALGVSKTTIYYDRTGHVEIDKHVIKEKIESGMIGLTNTISIAQVANLLTKALPRVRFEELGGKLGICNIYSPT